MRAEGLFVGLGVVGVVACAEPSAHQRFDDEVAPILERRCLSPVCHGISDADVEADTVDPLRMLIRVDGRGRIRDLEAARRIAVAHINTLESPDHSGLLRKPLALEAGGSPHEGGHPFATRDHPEYRTLRAWVEAEPRGGEDASLDDLTPEQRHFHDRVQPVLRDRGCMVARCHGPLVMFGGLKFEPPIDGSSGGFSVAQTLTNYAQARANLALNGDGARSRLVTKPLPLDAGGVIHRGGNDVFFPHVGGGDPRDDEGIRAMIEWADLERAAQVGRDAPSAPSGIVFVRGPSQAHGFLDLDAFRPGSDVWHYPSLAPGATAVNLTASAHPDGPADVRDPAVSHDGRRVVFSMRRSEADCHNLYEIGLDGTGLEQLTHDTGELPGGGKVVNRWPVYGPGRKIYFASTRAGTVDETGHGIDVDLYELRDGEPVRITFTPTPELSPSFLATGEFRGVIAFTVIRRLGGRFEGPIFRFPPDRSTHHPQADYHPHHGRTAPGEVTWTLRELPDGRNVTVLFDRDNAWEGGALAVIERQMGPDIPRDPALVPSVPGFVHAVSMLDPEATVTGTSQGGLYRDPAPLPDGRVVVSHARGPIALEDPTAPPPDTGLFVLSLGNARDGTATLEALDPLVDEPGMADDQPAIVYVRPEEDDPHEYEWSPDEPTGLLHLAGGASVVVIGQNIQPLGPKPIPPGIHGLRVVLWSSPPSSDRRPIDPTRILNQDPASTWWSNGVHGPTISLVEAPLAPDASIYVSAPAGAPFRPQVIDADGFAVGQQIAFWFYLQGGWRLTAGAPLGLFGRLCAGCHGAIDGDPAHALPPLTERDTDVVSSASVTLSSHAAANPRRPLEPVALPIGGVLPEAFHFRRAFGPLLSRSCASSGCHAGRTPAGGLALEPTPTDYYDAAYEALQAFGEGSTGGKRYIDERGASAHGSFLIEQITGVERGAPRTVRAPCPPPDSGVPALTEDEVRALVRWIDLGAIYRVPGAEEP
ncbi:MAG: PD40 domain-containing protein [Deltaproteobacteria bacterium]|nr:PD40 domain-containing protein [Deltaproteobacteria bacterium]